MRAVRAAWLRGGTSKSLFFRASDVPPRGPERDALILAALGSPDPSGLQLNGVGGGISSTSKVAIIAPSEREGFDVDYLFGQVEIKERRISWEGSCGNISAAVGLFALAEGLVPPRFGQPPAAQQIQVWQVNQSYGLSLHVPPSVAAPLPAAAAAAAAGAGGAAAGDSLLALAGVAGREPAVYVEIGAPHGERPLLPTGNEVDTLQLLDGSPVEATLVTAGNPTVFVPAAAAGLRGAELPAEMDYSVILPLVEHLREQAAPLLGVQGPSDQPRVAFVSPPRGYRTSAGEDVQAEDFHLLSRISTPGRIHHAHTGTGSIALACAAAVEGSVPWRCMQGGAGGAPGRSPGTGEALRIGHPGGVMEVRAAVQKDSIRGWHATGAGFDRTARYIMRGEVFVPPPDRAP